MGNSKEHCRGCTEDFYNGNNPYGVAECWCLKDAVLKTRFRLSVDTPMAQRSGYQKRQVYQCRRERGFVFLDEIPEYAR